MAYYPDGPITAKGECMTTRRKVLGYFASLLAGIPVLSLAAVGRAEALAPLGWLEKCAGLSPSFDRAAPIGRRYLAMTPAERNPTVLASRIAERVSGSGADFPAAVTSAVSRDFESGDVVMIDGWMLSRTEAQICGLAAMRPGNPVARL